MRNLALIGVTVVALSACGSGGGGVDGSNVGGTAGSNSAGSMLDAFTSFVANLVGTAPDNSEPASTDSVSVTTSDTTEPSKIQ